VELEALDHVGLVVSDMARSIRWYAQVLGLRRAHEGAWAEFPAVLEANGSGVALFPARAGLSRPTTRCATSASGPRAGAWRRPGRS
jgi:catechol 2,3-dioxygenase-like lactoylglutathione lyase family enzyme